MKKRKINMKNINFKRIVYLTSFTFFIVAIIVFGKNLFSKSTANLETGTSELYTTVEPNSLSKKVLVVGIDPIITSDKQVLNSDGTTYKNCNGKRFSECVNSDYNSYYISTMKNLVTELVDDIKDMSHGIMDIQVVDINGNPVINNNYTKLDVFPTYNAPVSKYIDGQWSSKEYYQSDSDSIIENFNTRYSRNHSYFENSNSNDPVAVELLDYKKLVTDTSYWKNEKSIVDGINSGLYDEVWLPTMLFITNQHESAMIGERPYWLNARSYTIPGSKNFAVMNVSMDRRDANLECFGHASESVLGNQVFKSGSSQNYSGQQNRYNILSGSTNAFDNESRTFTTTIADINDLDLWTRFTLNSNTSNYASVGNVHFTPNSVKDYNWINSTNINTSWADWFNYPNLTGTTTNNNFSTSMLKKNGSTFNSVIPSNYLDFSTYGLDYVLTPDDFYADARQHHRWMFYMMPHVNGRTKKGYSNNWWSYLEKGDYVESLTPTSTDKKEYSLNQIIDNLEFNVKKYMDTESKTYTLKTIPSDELNVDISDESVVKIVNNELKVVGEGYATITYYLDGLSAEYTIIVKDDEPENLDIGNTSQTEFYTTISGYPTKISLYPYCIGDTSYTRYVENDQRTFKMQTTSTKTCARYVLRISGVNPNGIYLFKSDVKGENVSSDSAAHGGQIMSLYLDNGFSYSYGYSNTGELNVKGTSDWVTGSAVVTPEYNYETENEKDAEILVYLGLGGINTEDFSAGTLWFKNLKLIDLEDEEQTQNLTEKDKIKVYTSKNGKIKFSQPNYIKGVDENYMESDAIQNKVDKIEDIYESYAELVGTETQKLYPYKNAPLKIIQNNTLPYGALANNPILINETTGIKLNAGDENTIQFGYLHEISHIFDGLLYSSDNSLKITNKYNFHSELTSNIKIPYALYKTNSKVLNGGTQNKDYLGLLNDYYNDQWATDLSFIKIIYPMLTEKTILENGTEEISINWDPLKKTYEWFNSVTSTFSKSQMVLRWIKKIDDYSDVDIRSKLTDDNITSLNDEYGTNLSKLKEITVSSNSVFLNSENISMFSKLPRTSSDVVVYTSSDESVATINENGKINPTGKAGTVTFTAKGYLGNTVFKSITKVIDRFEYLIPTNETDYKFERKENINYIKSFGLDKNTDLTKDLFLSNFVIENPNEIILKDKDGIIIDNNTKKIGTGAVLNSDGIDYTIIVSGDVNGDGLIDITDVSKLYTYFRNPENYSLDWNQSYSFAGDTNYDNTIEIPDISKLYTYFRNKEAN